MFNIGENVGFLVLVGIKCIFIYNSLKFLNQILPFTICEACNFTKLGFFFLISIILPDKRNLNDSQGAICGRGGGRGKLITVAFSKTTTIAAVQQSRPPHAE